MVLWWLLSFMWMTFSLQEVQRNKFPPWRMQWTMLFLWPIWGLLSQFPGLEIAQSQHGIKLHQSKYALDLMNKFNMKYFKPSKTPFLLGVKLEDAGSSPMINNTLYRKLIGCLLYFTHTRPDIYYAVSVASRYMYQPHEIHWRASKKILNFFQGTPTHGIFYKPKSDLELLGFSDND